MIWGQIEVVAVGFFAFSLWLEGCGGGSTAGSGPTIPAGTYSLMLTGTSANTTGQIKLALTVH
jgi:hypothetical protein